MARKVETIINPKHVGPSLESFLAENLTEEEIKVIQAKAKLLGEIIDARQELQLTQKSLKLCQVSNNL